VAVGTVAGLLLCLRLVQPNFWLAGDKRNQYVPVLQDMGRRLRAGDFPALDPALGPSGNYALDPQYAIHDPVHLAMAYLLSPLESQALAGFLLALVFLPVLAWGVTALLQRLEVAAPVAALGGVAAATSGYVFFKLAPDWWPGLIGTAMLPWLWWAFLRPVRVRRLLAIALFTALVVSAGWPSTWLTYVALTLGIAVEAWTRGGPVRDRLRPLAAQALAAAAGVAVAAAGLMPILRAADWTDRAQLVQNTNAQIINLMDVLGFAAPYLRGDLASYNGATVPSELPIFFFGWFLLVLIWLVRWRATLLRHPGITTALVAAVVMLMLSQAPSLMGPIRFQVRQLAGVQLFTLVGVLVAWSRAGLHLSRGRLVGIGVSTASLGFLAWARSPDESEPLLGVALVALASAILIAVVRLGRETVTALTALVGTVLLTVVAFGWAAGPAGSDVTPDEEPELVLGDGDLPAIAIYPKADAAAYLRWRDQGVGPGFTTLSRDQRYAPGYSSVSQRHFVDTFGVKASHGYTQATIVAALFDDAGRVGEPWIDVLGYRTALVERSRVDAFERQAPAQWQRVAESSDFVQFSRTDDPALTGRVTATVGEAEVAAVHVGDERQVYDVASADGATLVLRDIYWPGYVATVDGRPVPVRAVGDIVVGIRLPPGTDGRLEVRYRTVTAKSLALTIGGGAVLLLGSVAVLRGRRFRSR
jgi:hypothetical protein